MYIATKTRDENSSYVYVVVSKREGKKVRRETVAYLGPLENDRIPYLKAAFLPKEERPDLVEKSK